MPFRICKSFEIESGHMLSRHPDKCRFPHGHTRKVEFVLESDGLDENGMVCDFKVLGETMREFLECFDHALCINTEDPQYSVLKLAYGDRVIGFEAQDPTTEVLAAHFHRELQVRLQAYRELKDPAYPLAAGVKIARVRVWETSSSWAEYAIDGTCGSHAADV